jgi:hypothetical protein
VNRSCTSQCLPGNDFHLGLARDVFGEILISTKITLSVPRLSTTQWHSMTQQISTSAFTSVTTHRQRQVRRIALAQQPHVAPVIDDASEQPALDQDRTVLSGLRILMSPP